jgi:putative peptidoglycan lipid II flippase
MAALALAWLFPSAGHAAAWGVLIAGCLELLLLGADVTRQGARPALRWPRLDEELTLFLKRFAPATLGSAGTQVALFADTIIASFLTTGALSALYYADRLNQLPIGVIGIAVGTVLLPEMSKRLAADDEAGAHHSQNRAVELTLLLSVPCVVAFLMVPELIMRGLFTRGAFTTADAQAAAATLAAYALGLLPFVLLRNATITFLARGDTVTPVKALAVSVAVNVALKVALMGPLAQVGLALATAVGAWVNLSLLVWFAARQRLIVLDARLVRAIWRLAVAAIVLALVLWLAQAPIATLFSQWTKLRYEAMLATLGVLGACVYIGVVMALFGREWSLLLRRRAARPADRA